MQTSRWSEARSKLSRLRSCLKELGFARTFDLVKKNIAALVRDYLNHQWDHRHHVDTSGVISLDALTCTGEKTDSIWYEPTPTRTLSRIPSFLPDDLSAFTFVDFGSGKGRTVLYMSRFNLKAAVGVEFSRELHEVAERNIQTFANQERRCFEIQSVCADAADFPIPSGNCIIYFFHPFRSETMSRVINNLKQSFQDCPRAIIVLYYHPRASTPLDNLSILRKKAERPMPFDLSAEPCIYRRRMAVYETIGPRCPDISTGCGLRSGPNCLLPETSPLRPTDCVFPSNVPA